ncbi:sulfatase [bacterium]|nr:sulfatase [bacterium]
MNNASKSRLSVLDVGLILSISIGFWDVLFLLERGSRTGQVVASFIVPLALTTAFVFFTYVFAYYGPGQILVRILKLSADGVKASLAIFVGPVALLVSLRLSIPGSLGLDPFQLSLPVLIIVIASVATYFASESFSQRPKHPLRIRIFAITFPFLMAETVLAGLFIEGRMFFPIGFLFFCLTLWIFHRLSETRFPQWCLYFLAALIFIVPLIIRFQGDSGSEKAARNDSVKHKIQRIILITVDTLRADAVSAYNNRTRATPNIDRLAEDGMLFQNAISEAPWTLPAVSSIMTGVSPLVHLTTEVNSQFPSGLPTLPEYLKKAGFKTAAIGRNPHLVTNHFRGFQFYNFFPKSRISGVGGYVLHRFFPKSQRTDVSTSELTKMASALISNNRKQDFFLWLHYFDPHLPYSPPERFLLSKSPSSRIGKKCQTSVIRGTRSGFFVPTKSERDWIKELYLAEVQYVDDEVGKLINFLKENQLYEESLILLTSDHGEEFWEHGSFEHGHTVYNEVLQVPLVIKLPGSLHKSRIDQLVAPSAVVPTILELCNISSAPNSFSSTSLASLWNPDLLPINPGPVVSAGLLYYEEKRSLQLGGIKYIQTPVANREELYDLVKDPAEQFSIARSESEKLREARSLFEQNQNAARKLQSRYKIMGPMERELAPGDLEMLRSLGYVQ